VDAEWAVGRRAKAAAVEETPDPREENPESDRRDNGIEGSGQRHPFPTQVDEPGDEPAD
jgi:hypothetical protein